MPWGNKQPDLKNDPTYLEPRVTAVESSLAESTSDLLNRSLNAKVPFGTTLTPLVGDGFTDDTSALQAMINYCQNNNLNLYIPPSNSNKMFYKITGKLTITNDINIYGIKGNGGQICESTIRTTAFDQDIFEVRGNVNEIKYLTLGFCTGVQGNVTAVTSNSITFDKLSDVSLATLAAENMIANTTVTTFNAIYTNGTNMYQCQTSGGVKMGANIPSHTSGSVTVDGIVWAYYGAGTTYQQGQFSWNQVWRFTGVSGNTLTGVMAGPGQVNRTPDYYSIVSSVDKTGHLGSLEHFSTNIRTSSAINFVYGNDPKVEGIWFSQYGARCVTRSDSVQGGIWTNNVVDGAQHGFYGNLKYNLMSNNRFYGITQRAIYGTYATNVLITGNFFDSCNNGLELYNSSLLSTDKTGNIDNVLFNGNVFVGTTGTPIKLTGVTNSSFTNNRLGRTGGHAVWLTNCSRSVFKNITVTGIGDFYYSNTSSYFYLDGFNVDHEFADITAKYASPTQKSDYVFKFTVGNESNYNQNIYRNNHFNLTGIVTPTNICNVGELPRLTEMLFTGIKDSIPLTTHTLTPRQDKQVRFYNGSGSTKMTITLAKTNAKEGDFFILYFNCNTTGAGLAIVQEGSGTEIWSNYSTGVFTSQLLCTYTGSTWKINVLSNNFASRTTAPSTGTHVVGDFYPNNTPTELGTAGSKYILLGMRCIAAGTPGTWVEERVLTGN